MKKLDHIIAPKIKLSVKKLPPILLTVKQFFVFYRRFPLRELFSRRYKLKTLFHYFDLDLENNIHITFTDIDKVYID